MSNPQETTQELGKSLFGLLPKYRSHKQVAAARIDKVHVVFGRPQLHVTLNGEATKIQVPRDWYDHHVPRAGEWLVVYSDGYLSVSPHVAFAEGYHADGVAALAGSHPNWQMAEDSQSGNWWDELPEIVLAAARRSPGKCHTYSVSFIPRIDGTFEWFEWQGDKLETHDGESHFDRAEATDSSMAEASPAEARTCGCGPSACPDHKESHSEPDVPAEGFDAASVLAVLFMAAVVAAGAAWWLGWLA